MYSLIIIGEISSEPLDLDGFKDDTISMISEFEVVLET